MKKKTSYSSPWNIKPTRYISQPSYKPKIKEPIEANSLDEYTAKSKLRDLKNKEIERLQNQQEKRYVEQEARIEMGLQPSRTQAEINSFLARDTTKRVKQPKLQVGQNFSQEQMFMQDMFGSSRTWGTGQNLPQFNGILISGNGLINNEDNGETGGLFGLRR